MMEFRSLVVKVKNAFKKLYNHVDKSILPDTQKVNIPSNNVESIDNKGKNVKTKSFAILLAYNGINYKGMQRSKVHKTIEGELISALEKNNLITPDRHFFYNFIRASRTDAGVSAAIQVVACKMKNNYNINDINEQLPEDVKVLSIKRVTPSFNPQKDCLKRTYSYTFPTYALAPGFFNEYPKNFRSTEDIITKANETFKMMEGIHNFHNFTSKRHSTDPSSVRVIYKFQLGKPFVDEEEFVTLHIQGNSFMLHQIRKMVGFVLLDLKGVISNEVKENLFSDQKVFVPKAPGLGLVLENFDFQGYNRKIEKLINVKPLTWDELSEDIENFRKKNIISQIIRSEIETQSMFAWLLYLRDSRERWMNSLMDDGEKIMLP